MDGAGWNTVPTCPTSYLKDWQWFNGKYMQGKLNLYAFIYHFIGKFIKNYTFFFSDLTMRTYKRKTNRGNTPQDVMERAVREVLIEKKPCRAVAKDFDIPHVTLRRYVLKHKAKNEAEAEDGLAVVEVKLDQYGYARKHAVFKPEHEVLLVQYLLKASKLYYIEYNI